MKKLIYKIPGFLFALFFFLIVHCTLNIENCSAQWVQVSNGMGTNRIVNALIYSGNNIFAGTGDYITLNSTGVYLSTNNGDIWAQTSLNNRIIWSFAINGSTIFAGTHMYGVYLSTDYGVSWAQTTLNNRNVYAVATDGNNIFAGVDILNGPAGVYKSTDNGITWTQTSLNNHIVYSLSVSGNNVFAGINDQGPYYGVYLSTNNGTIWSATSFNNRDVLALAIIGNNIFAGTNSFGVYLSTNNGANWTQTSLNNRAVKAFAVNGNNIFAGTVADGVYVSTNNGTTWTQRNEGLGNLTVNALLILNNYIFAGINVSPYGVYRRPLNELITGITPLSNQTPKEFSLSQNYPNPFNPSTKIQYSIPDCHSCESRNPVVTLKVYDILGKEIKTLVNESLHPGSYEVTFDGSNFPSGMYFYQLKSENFSDTKKLTLLK